MAKIKYNKVSNPHARGPKKTKIEESIHNWFDGPQPGIGGGINPLGFPGNQGTPFSQQLSNPTTEFINLRWYLVSNMRQFLSEMYVELGLVQTICNVPVQDGLRGGVELKSKQLDENQLEELKNSLDRDDNITTIGQAECWNRLYGGAGLLILTDQDPMEPLDLAAINKETPIEFRAVDMWELFYDKQNTEGYDSAIQSDDFDFYNYYGEQVHKSRVMRMKGLTAPSFIRPRLRGWGFSVVETLVRSLNQYLKATNLLFEVLDQFKVDVFKIRNLTNMLMAPQGRTAIKERVAMANYQKNYQNALVMDTEDDWDHKQLSFSGLADMMGQIRMQVASDMRMPMTKLFGISAAGFNSGEDDIEVYNAMVESEVRNKIKYIILRVCEIKCQKLFGFVPDDLSVTFQPLRVLSAVDEENVKTQKFNRLLAAKQAGEINTQEFRDALNRGNILDVTLDTREDAIGGYLDDSAVEGTNKPYDPQDIDNPGADRLDTRKSRATEVGGASKEPPQPAPRDAGEPRNIAKVVPLKPKNSAAFDKATYDLDGGDNQIPDGRLPFFDNPKDISLWSRSLEESRQIYGGANKKFAIWKYTRDGGSWAFNEGDEMKNEDFISKWVRAKSEETYEPPKKSEVAGVRGDDGKKTLSNPGKVDETKWAKAEKATEKEYGSTKWPVVTSIYEKMGGKFHKKK